MFNSYTAVTLKMIFISYPDGRRWYYWVSYRAGISWAVVPAIAFVYDGLPWS